MIGDSLKRAAVPALRKLAPGRKPPMIFIATAPCNRSTHIFHTTVGLQRFLGANCGIHTKRPAPHPLTNAVAASHRQRPACCPRRLQHAIKPSTASYSDQSISAPLIGADGAKLSVPGCVAARPACGCAVVTKVRSLPAQWEHMVAVTPKGHEVLTAWLGGAGAYAQV